VTLDDNADFRHPDHAALADTAAADSTYYLRTAGAYSGRVAR
jgi:succinyl-CoA synthetase beta subunit